MNATTILIGLEIIMAASNAAAAAGKFKSMVETARAEGRDISLEELRSLASLNNAKLSVVLANLGM